MRKIAPALLLLLSAACASNPDAPVVASAPAPADARVGEMQTAMTELLERIDVLNDRIARLEQQVAASAPRAAAPSPARSEAPPATLGVASTTTAETSPIAAAAQPRTAATQPVVTAPAPAASGALASARIADSYRDAIVLYGKGRIAEARNAFQQVYDADPNGDLADNALFWIGETWFASGKYTEAMKYYGRVVSDFGDQNKAPDAMYKLAMTQEKTGDLDLARQTLQQVVQRYPYSSTAGSAKRELERLKY